HNASAGYLSVALVTFLHHLPTKLRFGELLTASSLTLSFECSQGAPKGVCTCTSTYLGLSICKASASYRSTPKAVSIKSGATSRSTACRTRKWCGTPPLIAH